jgi:hypothetical protein
MYVNCPTFVESTPFSWVVYKLIFCPAPIERKSVVRKHSQSETGCWTVDDQGERRPGRWKGILTRLRAYEAHFVESFVFTIYSSNPSGTARLNSNSVF